MSRQRIILLALLVAVLLAVAGWRIYAYYQTAQNDYLTGAPPQNVLTTLVPTQVDPSLIHPPAIRPSDPVRYGSATSAVSVIQYGDYACAACRDFAGTVKEVIPSYNGAVRFVWEDLPTDSSGKPAEDAAIYARCAGQQGKFWEAHDALMTAAGLNESDFTTITLALHLDANTLSACRADPTVKQAIDDDAAFAKSEGINSIPFIFVGTQGSVGAMSADQLRAAIQNFNPDGTPSSATPDTTTP